MNLHIHYSTGLNMIKKMVLLVCFFVVGSFAAGGDTVKIDATFKAFKDGDIIRANQHFHSPVDSIVKVVNGKLGNVNISSTANIAVSKLDSTGTIKSRKIRIDSIATIDSLKARVIKADSVSATTGTFSSNVIADSISVRAISLITKGVAPCSLYTGSTYVTSGTLKYTKIGNIVTVTFPDLIGTLQSGRTTIIKVPAAISSSAPYPSFSIPAYSLGTPVEGVLATNSSTSFELSLLPYSQLPAGLGGFWSFSVTYDCE